MRACTDWLRDARWGVFVHFLADVASAPRGTDLPIDDWNRTIDGFDVERLAGQLAEVGAGYFFLTLGQNSGYYLSPNATYDEYVGRQPSRLSRRDLIAELSTALVARGIRCLVYLPSHASAYDRQAAEGLKCTPHWDASAWQLKPGRYLADESVDTRLSEFQRRWEAVIREWSCRWGHNVSGWWFDGCYHADRMYRHADEPNFASFAAAAKAGNPDSLVAFNPGVKVPVVCATEFEDYTAGEVADAFPVAFRHRPLGRYVDGAQYHLLTFLGEYWGQGEPRFPDELVIGYTKAVNALEGVISWDVPTHRDGTIPDAFRRQLALLR